MTAQRHAFQCRANSTKTILDVWPEGTRLAKAVLGNPIEAKPKVTEKGHASLQRNTTVKQGIW